MRIQLTNDQYRNLQEALGDEIPDYMKDIIQKRYKGDYLGRDVPQHTDKIPNVKVQVTNEEVVKFASDQLIKSFTNKLEEQMQNSEIWKQYTSNPFGYSFFHGPLKIIMDKSIPNLGLLTSMQRAPLYRIFTYFYSKEFRLPDSRLNDDSTLRTSREKHESQFHAESVKWSNNKTGITSFLTTIKRVFPETFGNLDVEKITRDKHFVGLREPIINYQENVKKIGQYPLYLYITDKPDDKLRMSISQFYDSCQNIYTGGEQGTEWNKKLLSNVFDPNSKVAYLIYDKPYKDTKGNEHPITSIARCILRVNKKGGVMFDKVYPGNLENIFYNIITESTGIQNVGKDDDTYDYENVDGLPAPYMDRYKLRTSGGSNDEKTNALASALSINVNTVIQIDDETYQVKGRDDGYYKFKTETWKIITLSEGIEKASDLIRDNFLEMYRDYDIDEIIGRTGDSSGNIIDAYDFHEVAGMDDEWTNYSTQKFKEGKTTNLNEFFREVYNIETVSDMDKILKDNGVNSYQWFSNNVYIDAIIDGFVDSLGNDGRLRFVTQTLAWNTDEVMGYNNFVLFRRNYVMDGYSR
jgi:hypothetical protein